jgi:hypothetical protein
MTDGDKNNSTNEMINGVQEEGDPDTSDVGSMPVTTYIPAPNIIDDGTCKSCEGNIDIATQAIECWECRNTFHAIGCNKEEYSVCAPSVFSSAMNPAVNKQKGFATKFGTFLWLCNFCSTETEKRRGATVNDRVSILDKKIENLSSNFQTELKEMKNMLVSLTAASGATNSIIQVPVTESITALEAQGNIWNDGNRVEKLKRKMVIKSAGGKAVDAMLLEKTCVDNNISVFTSHKVRETEDTAITVKSQKDADVLQKCLKEHVFENVATRTPTIVVTGLCRKYDNNELITYIKAQNEGIRRLFECQDVSEEDKKIDVVAMNPLRSNPLVFKATVRVSNVIRSIIANQRDRLFIGNQTVCKVWDSFYIPRCYKCQQFGHIQSKEGTLCPNDAACGHCAGPHETRDCPKKNKNEVVSCVNCRTAGGRDYRHPAYWHKCSVLMGHQDKLRSTIPFYQGL